MPSLRKDVSDNSFLILILVSRKRRRSSSGGDGRVSGCGFNKSPFIIKRYQLVGSEWWREGGRKEYEEFLFYFHFQLRVTSATKSPSFSQRLATVFYYIIIASHYIIMTSLLPEVIFTVHWSAIMKNFLRHSVHVMTKQNNILMSDISYSFQSLHHRVTCTKIDSVYL